MLTLAIQAGGGSNRMGKDKARMPFLGQPLILRVMKRLATLADEVIVTTDRPADYAFLGVRCVPDIQPGRGSLGGLQTALVSASHPLVAVVACDMPFASLPLFEYLCDLLAGTDVDAVIPSTDLGLEPLHAVYRQKTCLPPVNAALEDGKRKIIAWFSEVNVRILDPEETALHDLTGLAFRNLNTPEEFSQAERQATASEI